MASATVQLAHALAQCSLSATSRCGSKSSAASARNSKPAVGVCLSSSLWGETRGAGANSKPEARRKGFGASIVRATFLDNDYEESEEEIRAAYEKLYGKPFGQSNVKKWEAVEDKDGDGDGEEGGSSSGRGRRGERPSGRGGGGGRGARGEFEERVVQIRRVTKVVKGGKQLSFRAVVIVGDKKGKVGVGVNKAKEVITAVQKAALNAKRNMVAVQMTKYKTFPHRADGYYGAAHVMLRPAAVGTGVIAGGAVRVVLELAGYENALGKQIRSENPLNNARAVVEAVTGMKQFKQVAAERGIPMEELWK